MIAELNEKLTACEKKLADSKDSSVKDVEVRMQAEINKIQTKNDKLK